MKYNDFMKEITKEELLEGLLGYGMFGEKIPPIFTSIPLYEFCKTKGYDWRDNNPHSNITYESMRNISVPRILSIPYPSSHVNLCRFLSDNWGKLQDYFDEKTKDLTLKVSRIHIRKLKDKKELFEMNYKNGFKDGYPDSDLSIGSRFIVKADISNCFPSIYTHAISWAIAGIVEAKKNQHNKELWYNKLDLYTRSLKDNETHGILIGPHASNIISEIILVAVDFKLSKKYKYYRHIDDYTCYTSTQQEADQFLIDLATELKAFSLLLNHKKTEIIKLPISSNDSWINKMNCLILSDKISIREIKLYIDTAIELTNLTGNVAIINYAIKVISKKELDSKAIDYYLKTIHHLIIIFPYLLPIIEDFVFFPFKTESSIIKKIATDILSDGIKFNRYDAMSFALYYAMKYNFIFDKFKFLDIVEKCEDCVFMVLAYLYDIKHLPKLKESYKKIALLLQKDQFERDKFWLFIYEVLPQTDLIQTDLKALKNGKLSFIKEFS